MKTPGQMREEAARCIRLARQTLDDSVASALLAHASELERRAHLIEVSPINNTPKGVPANPVAAAHVAAG